MENFVNKIKTKDGVEYSINDERIPEILAESEGKILKVEEGALTFADAPSGGGKLYLHQLVYYKPGPGAIGFKLICTFPEPFELANTYTDSRFGFKVNGLYDLHIGKVLYVVNNHSTPSLQYFVPVYTNSYNVKRCNAVDENGNFIWTSALEYDSERVFTDTVTEL